MATTLKDFEFDLTKVSTSGSQFDVNSNEVSVISGENTDAYVAGTDNTIVMTDFGTIKGAGSENVVNFTGAANMQSGAYTAKFDASRASIKTFDASNASAKLSLTTDLVSVNGGVLKAGSGDDTIAVKANNAVTSAAISVSGGLGADLFKIDGATASVNISDYNYAQGDRISVGTAPTDFTDAKFDTTGKLVVGTNTTVVGYGADGVYKFGVIANDGSGDKKYDYVAATNNADVKYTAGTDTLVFKANSGGNVTVDASKAAATSILATVKNADITLGGKKDTANVVSVGAGAGSTAIVDLGYGKDNVSVDSADTALTLKVGREDGVENELKKELDSNDTLVLTTGKISDVDMAGTDNADLKFGATSIAGAFGNGKTSTFNVQFGSDAAKKLAYSNAADAAIAYSTDVSYYLGTANGKITIEAGYTDDVVLDMVKFTHGITSVNLANTSVKANVDITATGNANVSVAADHAGVEWKFDLTAKDTTGATANLLDVTGADGVDRITLSDAKGNNDTVNGFDVGEDILVLSDVDKLTEKTFTVATNDVILKNSQASIAGAFHAGTDLNVVLSDGTAKKVALADANATVKATQETTTVINQTDKDGIVTFDIDEATENNAAFVVDMTGTVSNAIDYLGKFTSIDATVGAANALIIGNEATTSIKATGSADHGSVVWAGAKANAAIEFAKSAATADDAGNILWTGALDGASSVEGFDAKDKLYVYGVDGLSKTAVAESFGINNNNAVYHTGASSMTFLGGTNKISVMYMDSTAEGGYGYQNVAISGASLNFATDVDVYIGTTTGNRLTVGNDAVEEGKLVAINLSNKGAGSVEEGGAYYNGVHNINASASAGTFLLIGDNTNGANLTGGAKGNAIWGGGDASQNMEGGAGVADIFWFGSKDGHDVVDGFGTKDGADGDAVFLYDATSIDAVQITAEGNNAKVVFKNTNATLTLNDVSDIDDVKFMLNTADGGYAYYKYDSKTSAFVQQKA